MNNFEKYLRGEPLTEELAAIREGRIEDEETPVSRILSAMNLDSGEDRPLSAQDRFELRELVHSPAWEVLTRLQNQAIRKHIDSATSVSQDDPLQNAQRIAQEWALVTTYKRVCQELRVLVEAEIIKLEEERGRKNEGILEPDEA